MGFIMNDENNGKLYVCATPIGNLEDITLRVLRVLREVDLIAAEDTRHTLQLLNHYGIKTPLTSYHEHNKGKKGRQIVDKLLNGLSLALVTDSGMPGISDPGYELISICHEEGIPVTICPGATAGISGLVLSGICPRRYVFEGFLPREGRQRKEALATLVKEYRTVVLYEAPHRLVVTLSDLLESLGERKAATVREITKKFEEVRKGNLTDLIRHYEENIPRGEFVIVLEGSSKSDNADYPKDLTEHVEYHLINGLDEKDAMKKAAKDRGISKSEVYSMYKLKK